MTPRTVSPQRANILHLDEPTHIPTDIAENIPMKKI